MPQKPFKPKPGQVDFTRVRWAPVINCVLRYRGKILLVRRSQGLRFYPGYWNGVSGFLDDRQSLQQKVVAELREELGLPASAVRQIRLGKVFDQEEPRYGKTWIVHPVLVDVKVDVVKLDWEADQHRWVTPRAAKRLKLLPGFSLVLDGLRKWL